MYMKENVYTFLYENPPPCETEKCVTSFIYLNIEMLRKSLWNRMVHMARGGAKFSGEEGSVVQCGTVGHGKS